MRGWLRVFTAMKNDDETPAGTFFAPAYLGDDGWECAACNAVTGRAMDFGEKKGK